ETWNSQRCNLHRQTPRTGVRMSTPDPTTQQPHDPRPTIGISMGDPAGIGAEVIIKALSDPEIRKLARYVIFGLNELLAYTADLAETEPFCWRHQHER